MSKTDIFSQFSGNKILDRMFKKVDNVVWDISTGSLSIVTDDGLLSFVAPTETNPNGSTSLNMMAEYAGIPIPAFAQSYDVDKVAVGDLIYNNGAPMGWVIENKSEGQFKIHTINGIITEWRSPNVTFGITSGVLVLKSLISMTGGGEAFQGTSNNLMQMMMLSGMSGSDDRMSKMIPMMLMSGGLGGGKESAGGMNPMMMMMMMGGGGNF